MSAGDAVHPGGNVAGGRQALLRQEAEALFPGGVNSPARNFAAVGRPPLLIEAGRDAHVRDADGNWYVDYIGSRGSAILGHAVPAVVDAVRAAALDGMAFGATSPREIELGARIRSAMPSMERLRFVSSGTEAVMSAIRLARGATGRDLIVMFDGGAHGHADSLLVAPGSSLATPSVPGSAGVTAGTARDTLVVERNDPQAIAEVFELYPDQVAAVIVEPVGVNAGVIAPAQGFLEWLRDLTGSNGTLLVFDEVVTGFRVAHGGAQARYGIRPDITTLGAVIGGGLPIGAYGGRSDLVCKVAPEGPVHQAGTLSGHPLAMAAGAATLDLLTPEIYTRLEATGTRLEEGLREIAAAAGREVAIGRVGSLLTVFFRAGAPRNGAQARASDQAAYARFFGSMLDQGILLPPSQLEAWCIGAAHGEAEISATLSAARRAFSA
ncbi:MAG: glutamate-1-semialdehyde 2,1-aminomutase [Chloroflexota bacterium]